MKNFGRKVAAILLAAATVAGTGVSASAAARVYDATVEDEELIFSRSGKKLKPYTMKNADVKLMLDDEDDLLVCYTDTRGKYKGISLGSQRTLKIGGDIRALTLSNSLGSKVNVTVDEDADIDKMNIASKGDVEIEGDIDSLVVTGASDIEVTGSSNIAKARITSRSAELSAEAGTDVRRVYTVNRSNATGSGIGTRTYIDDDEDDDDDDDDYYSDSGRYDYRTKLEFDEIDVTFDRYDGDKTLDDIEYELRSEIEAYGYDRQDDKHTLDGTFRWDDPYEKIFDEDDPESDSFRCRFRFTPDDDDYPSVSDYIRVNVYYER